MKQNRKPSSEILWRLSNNTVRLRKARGYNQAALGRRCGLSKGHISNIEQEKMNVSVATIEMLCAGLSCSVGDLFMKIKPDLSTEQSASDREENERLE